MFKFVLVCLLFSFNAFSNQWEVDCANHCFFSDFNNNCQGVYYKYVDQSGKSSKSYSSWNSNLNGCYEQNELTFQSHLIYKNQISCNCSAATVFPPANQSTPLTNTTRSKLELLRAQIQAWTPCAPGANINSVDIFNPFSFKSVKSCQFLRKNNLPRTYISAKACFTGMQPWTDHVWRPCHFDGDQLANTSQSCLGGDEDLCSQIKDAQNPETGFWYRDPHMRRHPETAAFQPSFSRDQMLGMLSYWIKKKNKAAVFKWLYAVKSNGKSAPWGPAMLYNLCAPRPDIPRPENLTLAQWDQQLPDDRCAIIPDAWGLIYFAAKSAGLTNYELQSVDADMYNNMISASIILDAAVYVSAVTVPAIGTSAFQMGDLFDGANIRYHAGGNNNTILNSFKVANNRTSKLNPLYHFRAEGKATEHGAYLIRKYCSGPKPNWGHWFHTGWDNYWSNQTGYWQVGMSYLYTNWQYAGGIGAYGDRILPHGHDCLTLLNLYLGNSNLTELECDNGDQLINGACKKYSFPIPKLAQINGIDYKLNKMTGKIDYMAVDQARCPYGGTFVSAEWNRCEIDSGINPSTLNSATNYWVDPYEKWPGVYYQKSHRSCPHGGVSSGGNCQIKAYSTPSLRKNVRYWVDTNPSWPGVYYQKIDGTCLYGGASSGPNCQVIGFGANYFDQLKNYFSRSNPSYPGIFYHPRVVPEKKNRLILRSSF